MSNSINPTKIDIVEQDLEDLKKSEPKEEVDEIEKIPVPPPINIVNKKTSIHFWAEDPNVLLQPEHALEFFPTESMSFNQKLNAVTRIVLILTALSYLSTKKMNIIVVSVISIVCIYLMFYYHNDSANIREEGFKNVNGNLVKLYNRNGPHVEISPDVSSTFQQSHPTNPLSNVLISDYDYNPTRKPAEPSYTKEGKDNILEETKRSIQLLNPDQPGIDKKLFQDVTDNLELEQSMRQFYSTANTTIPNDQTSFAEFCYGDMISAKEGNMFASVRNNPRHNLY
jgi:hypothetical protein